MAVGTALPLLLRGPTPVGSWMPQSFGQPEPDLYARIAALHSHDPVTGPAIAEGLQGARLQRRGAGGTGQPGNRIAFPALCAAAGQLLGAPTGRAWRRWRSAGWDTHTGAAWPPDRPAAAARRRAWSH